MEEIGDIDFNEHPIYAKIELEDLCNFSCGINFYMNAKRLEKSGDYRALILFDAATYLIENEIKELKCELKKINGNKFIKNKDERIDKERVYKNKIITEYNQKLENLLSALYGCYQKLSVESLLPPEYRTIRLEFNWLYYVGKSLVISRELEDIRKSNS